MPLKDQAIENLASYARKQVDEHKWTPLTTAQDVAKALLDHQTVAHIGLDDVTLTFYKAQIYKDGFSEYSDSISFKDSVLTGSLHSIGNKIEYHFGTLKFQEGIPDPQPRVKIDPTRTKGANLVELCYAVQTEDVPLADVVDILNQG